MTTITKPTIPAVPQPQGPHSTSVWLSVRSVIGLVPRPWRVALATLMMLSFTNFALDRFGGTISVEGDGWGALRQLAACERQGNAPDIVILGSSRAQAGIAPPVLDAELATRLGHRVITCDLAVSASVPLEDYYLLRRLLEDGVHPRFLVYATAEFAFNAAVTETNFPVRDNVRYLARLSDLPDLTHTHIADGTGSSGHPVSWYLDFAMARLMRPYADRRGFEIALCQLQPKYGPCPTIVPHYPTTVASPELPGRTYPIDAAEGWYPLPEATPSSLDYSRWQYTSWLARYAVAPDALNYLGRIVDLTRTNYMGMVLVNTPILPQHLAFFPNSGDYLIYLDALHHFADAHNVPFYDESFSFDGDLNDFADTNHLNYWGALAFTGWLALHVVLPEYQQQLR